MTKEKTPVRAKFQARYLPMIAPFMATNDIRFYLNGFLIERAKKGVYIVGTNGRIMAVVHDAEGLLEGTDRLIVRRDAGLVSACKPKKIAITNMVIVQDGRVSVAPDFGCERTDIEKYVMPGSCFIEGKFPEWRKVLPNFAELKPGLSSACVNPEYIGIFEKVEKQTASRFGTVRFWQRPDPNAGIVVQLPSIPEFLGMVMPVHDTERSQDHCRKLLDVFKK